MKLEVTMQDITLIQDGLSWILCHQKQLLSETEISKDRKFHDTLKLLDNIDKQLVKYFLSDEFKAEVESIREDRLRSDNELNIIRAEINELRNRPEMFE